MILRKPPIFPDVRYSLHAFHDTMDVLCGDYSGVISDQRRSNLVRVFLSSTFRGKPIIYNQYIDELNNFRVLRNACSIMECHRYLSISTVSIRVQSFKKNLWKFF
jgi:hypothetical protein